MTPSELFTHIQETEYNKNGFDLDWKIEKDKKEKKIRLMYQSSMTPKDWIINIIGFIPFLYFPYIMCWGWKSVFNGCKTLILEELIRKANKNKSYTIEIAGHSYGGVMSILTAIELYKKTKIKADVITFGSPKPLFLFLSKWIAKIQLGNVIQYAHRSDIVTYCPPFIGYHNVTVKRIGKFRLKDLFNPEIFHLVYDDESLYN